MKKIFVKHIVTFIIFCLSLPTFSQSFSDYFHEKSLRIDFQLYGDSKNTNAVLSQLKEEPYWGGSHHNLQYPNYGMYRVLIFDKATKTLLFSKGFSSLFNEWQNTDKSINETRFFYHSVQIPFPKKEIIFTLQYRKFNGEFATILQKNIHPNNYFILKEKTTNFTVTPLLVNGDAKHKVDIAILAEGYTQQEMPKFISDATKMIDYLFSVPPFDELKKDFNVYAIQSASLESGTDIPGKRIYKNTIFNSSFYTFDMERYLTVTDMKSVADVASLVPYDQIYILTNSAVYGGGAFYNHLNLTTTDHFLSKKVFVHELGHGLVGLADEYYDSSTSFDEMYNQNIEPWEANITTLVNFDAKWKNMVTTKTPIPTPANNEYKNSVGAFEGGGYVAKGIYRPMQNCRMKSNNTNNFCPVCTKAIKDVVFQLTK